MTIVSKKREMLRTAFKIETHKRTPPGDRGKAGSRVSLERGGKPNRAVLTASNILDHDAGH